MYVRERGQHGEGSTTLTTYSTVLVPRGGGESHLPAIPPRARRDGITGHYTNVVGQNERCRSHCKPHLLVLEVRDPPRNLRLEMFIFEKAVKPMVLATFCWSTSRFAYKTNRNSMFLLQNGLPLPR